MKNLPLRFDKDLQKQAKDDSFNMHVDSTTYHHSDSVVPLDFLNILKKDSSNNHVGSSTFHNPNNVPMDFPKNLKDDSSKKQEDSSTYDIFDNVAPLDFLKTLKNDSSNIHVSSSTYHAPHSYTKLDFQESFMDNYSNNHPSTYHLHNTVVQLEFLKSLKDDYSHNHVGSSTYYLSDHASPLNFLETSNSNMLNSIPSHGFNIDDYDVDNGDDDYLEESETHSNLSDDDHNSNLAANFHDGELPTGVEADVNPDPEKLNQNQPNLADNDAIGLEVKAFKQFDTVQSDSDHYFAKPELYKKSLKAVKRPSKDWARRIQHEWKILEKDLPDSIYVRVYEDRMDLLRAVIIGPAGTPYHDGLYFFDAYFPHRYPDTPPLVHYHSGGIQLNPNLYESGKVCLSLLGTWSGGGCENWDPSNSTMLQVLVSIQALVLNAKPFYNEPAYVSLQNTQEGELSSLRYNEDTFLLACRAMLYTLRKPPKHFKDFVAAHYRSRGKAILMACRAYINGAQIGCLDEGGVQNVQEGDKSCSKTFARVHNRFSNTFKFSLRVLCNDLLKEFTVRGADCDEFLSNVKNRVGEGAGTSLEL